MRSPFTAALAALAGLAEIAYVFISNDVASQRHASILAMLWLIVYMQASDTKRSK